MPPEAVEEQGRQMALQAFKTAASRVPAYQDFLRRHRFNPDDVETIGDFHRVPIIDKKNYLRRYPLEALCLDGNLHQMYHLAVSSGATGEPCFWPMTPEQTAAIPSAFEIVLTEFFGLREYTTLFFINLALGSWAAGELCAEACRTIARKPEYPMTVISPGLELEETLRLIQKLAEKYDQIAMLGYPGFMRDVIDQGREQGIDWSKLRLRILTGGECYSEDWRDWMMKKSGIEDPVSVWSLFGTADAGVIGFETPMTVRLRRTARADKDLSQQLFGDQENLPMVMQFKPAGRFVEEMGGELVVTAPDLGLPLVRYCLHDRGGVIPFASIPSEFRSKDSWPLPVFYVFGRTAAIHLYGVNIYQENIMAGLENSLLFENHTGRFKFKAIYDEDHNQSLSIKIELKGGVARTRELEQVFAETIVKALRNNTSEYNKLYSSMGEKVTPHIELLDNKTGAFASLDKFKTIHLDTP